MFRYIVILPIIFLLGCQKDNSNDANDQLQQFSAPQQVRVSTFNLKWYGLHHNKKGGKEFRNNSLKKFIDQELSETEVILFTEVVNSELLNEVVGHKWACQADEFTEGYSNQQHLVFCYDKNKFQLQAYDQDHIIPEVAIKRPGNTKTGLRPALHTQLCTTRGHCFLQVIGLHLKAGPSWHKRARQVRFIRDELSRQANPLPTLMIGDMNSYRKDRKNCKDACVDETADPASCEMDPQKKFECSEDDIDVFNSILKQAHGRQYRSVTLGERTYGSGEWARDYDHLILTPEITAKDIKTYTACGKDIDPKAINIPYSSYRKYFSDHCPVSATLLFSQEVL